METLKLILAGAFATAAALRALIGVNEAFTGLMAPTVIAFFSGPLGLFVETAASLAAGILIARRVRVADARKSTKR